MCGVGSCDGEGVVRWRDAQLASALHEPWRARDEREHAHEHLVLRVSETRALGSLSPAGTPSSRGEWELEQRAATTSTLAKTHASTRIHTGHRPLD